MLYVQPSGKNIQLFKQVSQGILRLHTEHISNERNPIGTFLYLILSSQGGSFYFHLLPIDLVHDLIGDGAWLTDQLYKMVCGISIP